MIFNMVFNIKLTDIEGNEIEQNDLYVYVQALSKTIDPKIFVRSKRNTIEVGFETRGGFAEVPLTNLVSQLLRASEIFPGVLIDFHSTYEDFAFKVYFYGGRSQFCNAVRGYEPINLSYFMGLED